MKIIRLLLFIVFQLFVGSLSFAQSSKTLDSLNTVLKNAKHDTTRVQALVAISNEDNIDLDTAIIICNKALLIIENNLLTVQNPIKRTFLKAKADILNNMGQIYSSQKNYTNALECLEESLKVRRAINDKIEPITLHNIAIIYKNQGKIEKALKHHFENLTLEKELKDTFGLVLTLNGIGLIYYNQANINKALNYYFQSLKVVEGMKDKKLMPAILINIGKVYNDLGESSNALRYYQKSLNLSEEIHYKMGIVDGLSGMALILSGNGEYKKALVYFKKSLKLLEEMHDNAHIAVILNNIGFVYKNQNDIKNALFFYNKSLEIGKKLNDNPIMIIALHNLGDIYFIQKNYVKAEVYLKNVLQMEKKIGYPKFISKTSGLLSKIYEVQGKYKEAYKMHLLFKQMADSIKNDETHKASVKNQLQYEFDKEALQIKQKQMQKEASVALANQKKLQQKNYWIYGSIALLLLLSLVGLLFYNNYKSKQKEATQQNIVLEQKLLRSQMNPHFIFNSLGIIHEYIKKNKSDEAGNYLIKFSKLMRLILENSRQEYVSLEKEIETLTYYLNLYQLVLQNGFNYQIKIDETIDTEITCIPPMLAQPFIENALKHGIADKQSGELLIHFKKINDSIVFEVTDNGIGYSRSQELKAEQLNKHTSLATQIVYERLANINKDKKKKINISISDMLDSMKQITGTKVEFEIPVIYSV